MTIQCSIMLALLAPLHCFSIASADAPSLSDYFGFSGLDVIPIGDEPGPMLVVDLDVHQGDGTAAIFADEPRVFTCSIHGARNFPLRKQTSDLDVPLPDATGDEAYLEALEVAFGQALERARPDFVFYQGGVDPLAEDRLGRLALSQEGLQRRDERVFAELRRRGIPFVLTLGGGYAEPIKASVRAHVGTYRAVTAALRSRPAPQSSQGST